MKRREVIEVFAQNVDTNAVHGQGEKRLRRNHGLHANRAFTLAVL
jgi:hypothetical protein